MKTKEKILNQALDLFNTKGVENITTRHIAAALGISQGNLHYHYPTKNVVIETLFHQFMEDVKNAERYIETSFPKEEVILSMKDNYKIMYKYRFFFKDNEVVWRRLPSIESITKQLFDLKKSQILHIIQLYKDQGIFREEISQAQIEFLAEQFIFSITSWLSAKEYHEIKGDVSDYYARFTFRIWLPYLNEGEMEQWEALLN